MSLSGYELTAHSRYLVKLNIFGFKESYFSSFIAIPHSVELSALDEIIQINFPGLIVTISDTGLYGSIQSDMGGKNLMLLICRTSSEKPSCKYLQEYLARDMKILNKYVLPELKLEVWITPNMLMTTDADPYQPSSRYSEVFNGLVKGISSYDVCKSQCLIVLRPTCGRTSISLEEGTGMILSLRKKIGEYNLELLSNTYDFML